MNLLLQFGPSGLQNSPLPAMQQQQPGIQQHQPMDPIKSENMKHEVKPEGGHADMKPDMGHVGEGVSKPSLSQTNPTLDNMLRNPSGDPSDKSGSIIDTTSGGGIVSTTEIKDEGVSGGGVMGVSSEGQDEISALLGGSSPGPGQAEVEKALKTSEAVSASLAASASTSSPITTSTMSSPSTTFSSQQVWSLALNFFPFLLFANNHDLIVSFYLFFL